MTLYQFNIRQPIHTNNNFDLRSTFYKANRVQNFWLDHQMSSENNTINVLESADRYSVRRPMAEASPPYLSYHLGDSGRLSLYSHSVDRGTYGIEIGKVIAIRAQLKGHSRRVHQISYWVKGLTASEAVGIVKGFA